ncbi:hypothetical protein H5J24_22955 [Chryseobacterium capnotolerans]|uniref:hypothetical protein n=1 Tax=Chryseobacterium TaxID=59732 RepID=UPI00083B07F2|nr:MULTISPECIES: hypothetical protein [Chryseobacterium]UHO38358.1 hypothetical protein H5J24_22955 [Chryseobacterium capnotolerans]
MYIGTTIQGRPDQFIILEKGDLAEDCSSLMKEKGIYNLIVSGKQIDENVLTNITFSEVFSEIKILHIKDTAFNTSEELYQFKNVTRLEIKNCKFKGKEAIELAQLKHLRELFTGYSKRFQNLFNHPSLKTLFIENFEDPGFEFPVNHQLETLSIEESKECLWASLPNLKAIKSLYLVDIPSVVDISWITEFSHLTDIDFTSCKNMENVVENISEVLTLKTIFLAYLGDFNSLSPLKKLIHLQELTIENGGRLMNKKNIDFLHKISDLEFSIDMKNCVMSNDN